MRKRIIAALIFAAVAGWTASAVQQPIAPTKGDSGITFRPKTPGDPAVPAKEPVPATPTTRPVAKDGGIVFSPQTPGLPAPPIPPTPPTPPTTGPGSAPAPTPATEGKVLFDYWFVAAVDGERIGYLHWSAREVEKDGRKLWVGSKYQKLTVARFGQVVSQWGEEGTTETPEGEVLVTTFGQGLGKDQALALTGVVDGKTLKVKGAGVASGATDTPWPGGVTGVVREPMQVKDKKPKPGESFETLNYVASLNRVVKTTTTAEAEETLVLWPSRPAQKLLRLASKMEPIGNFKLPSSYLWCDATTFEPLRVEFDFAALGGKVTFLRTTQEAATVPVTKVRDVFDVQSIRLDRDVPGIHTRLAMTYKITMPKDDDPATTFAVDSRQEVKNADTKSKTFDLTVTAIKSPLKLEKPIESPGKEFLGSSFFVNWDNDAVKGHAAKAVSLLPNTASAWDKGKAIERWVKENMKAVEFSQAMATADNVAKTLSGDCTEYAMLAAAMCRAVGVPSRTALGLVYVPASDGGKPFLAYHMWFEVFVDGQWLGLDATLGQGGIGPGHVKITDHSWHDERSFAPLLPVLRVLMAKPTVEVK